MTNLQGMVHGPVLVLSCPEVTHSPRSLFCAIRLEELLHALHRHHQLVRDPGLVHRVARAGDQAQVRLGPGALEVQRGAHRAHKVHLALHQHARQVADALHVGQQGGLAAQEGAVDAVVALQQRLRAHGRRHHAGDGGAGRRGGGARAPLPGGGDVLALRGAHPLAAVPHHVLRLGRPADCHLVRAPHRRRAAPRGRVLRRQPAVVRHQGVGSLRLAQVLREPRPGLRVHGGHPSAVHPVDLAVPHEADAAQDEPRHPAGMRLRVREGQRDAPGAPEQQPALDPQLAPQLLVVGNQRLRGVALQLRLGRGGAAAALVHQHHLPLVLIEEAGMLGPAAGARAAVHEERHARSIRVAVHLVEDLVAVRHLQPA
mmetsp:Transcript_45142/g.114275  ORF Transcript_45142/g.114275 Transcript_45142/m.114275 type:complete len:371 (-) Transcript_45142:85-1197(-)